MNAFLVLPYLSSHVCSELQMVSSSTGPSNAPRECFGALNSLKRNASTGREEGRWGLMRRIQLCIPLCNECINLGRGCEQSKRGGGARGWIGSGQRARMAAVNPLSCCEDPEERAGAGLSRERYTSGNQENLCGFQYQCGRACVCLSAWRAEC